LLLRFLGESFVHIKKKAVKQKIHMVTLERKID
jgi:hypothetical protein